MRPAEHTDDCRDVLKNALTSFVVHAKEDSDLELVGAIESLIDAKLSEQSSHAAKGEQHGGGRAGDLPRPRTDPRSRDGYGNDPEAYRSGTEKLTPAEFVAIHKDAFDEGWNGAVSALEPSKSPAPDGDGGEEDREVFGIGPNDGEPLRMYVYALTSAAPAERGAWANIPEAERDFYRACFRFARDLGRKDSAEALERAEARLAAWRPVMSSAARWFADEDSGGETNSDENLFANLNRLFDEGKHWPPESPEAEAESRAREGR